MKEAFREKTASVELLGLNGVGAHEERQRFNSGRSSANSLIVKPWTDAQVRRLTEAK